MSHPEQKQKELELLPAVLASPDAEMHLPISDYEQGLFANGVYTYDPNSEIDRAEDSIRSHSDWLKRAGWSEDRSSDSLNYDITHQRWELAWKQHFSGRVPKQWRIWHGAMHDVEVAGERDVQLSDTLIDAAVSHSHHLVTNAAGKHQVLNTHQLAIAFARDLPPWNLDEIVSSQIEKGMTQDQIREARKLSEEIRKRMASGTIQIGMGDPELPPTPKPKRHAKGILRGVISRG